MGHVDRHVDAVAFVDELFLYLTDSEIVVISMMLEDHKVTGAAIGQHLGVTKQRARTIKAAVFTKAHQLRGEIESGEPCVPLRAARRAALPAASPNGKENGMKQATFKEQQILDEKVDPSPGPLADQEAYYGPVKVKLLQELEVVMPNNRGMRWGPGTWSVNEDVAKILLAQGRRMMADVRVGPVALRVEEDVEE